MAEPILATPSMTSELESQEGSRENMESAGITAAPLPGSDEADKRPLTEVRSTQTENNPAEEDSEGALPDDITEKTSNKKIQALEIEPPENDDDDDDNDDDRQSANILQIVSEDLDDLDEEAQGLLADERPSMATKKTACLCFGPFESVGSCTIFLPAVHARSGWGILGPHWFGPPCVMAVILSASSFFIRHAYERIGPITATICFLWTIMIFYLLTNTCYRDPGIVRKDQEIPTPQHRWCELCKTYQPPKGAHCTDCNVCVAGFDHHCVWMGCCIGKKNLKQFNLFNLSWLLYLGYCVIWVSTLGPILFRHKKMH